MQFSCRDKSLHSLSCELPYNCCKVSKNNQPPSKYTQVSPDSSPETISRHDVDVHPTPQPLEPSSLEALLLILYSTQQNGPSGRWAPCHQAKGIFSALLQKKKNAPSIETAGVNADQVTNHAMLCTTRPVDSVNSNLQPI